MPMGEDSASVARERVDQAVPLALEMQSAAPANSSVPDADRRPDHRPAEEMDNLRLADDEDAMPPKRKEEELSDGVMVALSKLRKQ